MPRLDGCFAHFHDFLVPFPIIVPSNPFHHQVFEFDVGDKVEVTSSPQIGGESWLLRNWMFTQNFYTSQICLRSYICYMIPIYLTYLPNYLSVDLSTYIYIYYIYIYIHTYIYIYIIFILYIYIHVGASINVGIPKWMVMENPTNMEWFGRTPISGNLHV